MKAELGVGKPGAGRDPGDTAAEWMWRRHTGSACWVMKGRPAQETFPSPGSLGTAAHQCSRQLPGLCLAWENGGPSELDVHHQCRQALHHLLAEDGGWEGGRGAVGTGELAPPEMQGILALRSGMRSQGL